MWFPPGRYCVTLFAPYYGAMVLFMWIAESGLCCKKGLFVWFDLVERVGRKSWSSLEMNLYASWSTRDGEMRNSNQCYGYWQKRTVIQGYGQGLMSWDDTWVARCG